VDFKEIVAEQNRCAETQRLLCGTSARQAPNTWLVMFLLAFFDQ
jgi:hypothetical protein